MIDRYYVVKDGKVLTVWGYRWQASASARRNGGVVIWRRERVGL